ncbi:GDSL-type esterase/lipase family protein [Paracoccus endophyticus]|uniref:GDSL-type esterase/lipase family protein n=1 Tax=Paracoccus endophyticus TaxID=2233774 RepID=UPI000DD8028F|nr:GDSL-type esterase/lipase family protein [Paracoccus endophyticus]
MAADRAARGVTPFRTAAARVPRPRPAGWGGGARSPLRVAVVATALLAWGGTGAAQADNDWAEVPTRVQGRVAIQNGKIFHQWPAIRAEAEFTGPKAALALSDSPARYRVTLDPGAPDTSVVVLDRPPAGTLDLAPRGPGPHRLTIETLGETPDAPGVLPRLLVPAAEAARPAPASPRRRIEVIGDSDSTGHGILHDGRDCDEATTRASSDSTAAWPAQVARALGADLRLHAATGLGLIRNYGGAAPDRTLPALYPRTLWAGEGPRVDTPPTGADPWQPQLIVVAIGSNDFASPLQPGEPWDSPRAVGRDFAPALAEFLAEVRAGAPDAAILLAVWPEYGRPYLRAHRAALDLRAKAGDHAVALLALPRMGKTACGWHPSVADHAAIAQRVLDHLAAQPAVFR